MICQYMRDNVLADLETHSKDGIDVARKNSSCQGRAFLSGTSYRVCLMGCLYSDGHASNGQVKCWKDESFFEHAPHLQDVSEFQMLSHV